MLKFGSLFGGGVLVATGFVHMLAPAIENLTAECNSKFFTEDYPGKIIIILRILSPTSLNKKIKILKIPLAWGYAICLAAMLFSHLIQLSVARSIHRVELVDEPAKASTPLQGKVPDLAKIASLPAPAVHSRSHSHDHADSHEHLHDHGPMAVLALASQTQRAGTIALEVGILGHSVIIGFVLGVAGLDEYYALYAAIAFHQFFEGFALGSVLHRGSFTRGSLVLATLAFAFTTPAGLAIGLGVRRGAIHSVSAMLLTTGHFDAIAAGVLIYDGLVNVILAHFSSPKSLENPKSSLSLELMVLYAGAFTMCLIGKWA